MKKLITTIGHAFHSSTLYKKVKDESTGTAIGFLFKSAVLLGCTLGVVSLIAFLCAAPSFKKDMASFVASSYPDGLVITIDQGVLHTNTQNTVYVGMPHSWQGNGAPMYLAVLTPQEPAELTTLTKYNSALVLGSNGIIALNTNTHEARVYPYGKDHQEYTKQSIIDTTHSVLKSSFIACLVILIPLIVVMTLIVAGIHMIWIFLVSLLVLLMWKVRKLSFTYKQSYRMAVYALVPLLILEVVAIPLGFAGKIFSTLVVLAIIAYASQDWEN